MEESIKYIENSKLKDIIKSITHDERDHMFLSWESLKFILQKYPHLRDIAKQEFFNFQYIDNCENDLYSLEYQKYGIISPDEKKNISKRLYQQIIDDIDIILNTNKTYIPKL